MKVDTWHIDIDQLEYELNLHRPTASTNPYPESVVSSFQIGGKLHLLTMKDNHCGPCPFLASVWLSLGPMVVISQKCLITCCAGMVFFRRTLA
jgi:hypothetical protein